MSIKDVLKIAWQNLTHRKLRTFLVVMGVIIGISSLIFLLSLAGGVKQNVILDLTEKFAPNQITVTPQYKKVWFIMEEQAEESGVLDQETIEKIQKIKGVTKVSPQIAVAEASTAKVSMFGHKFEIDTPIFGVDPEIIQSDIDSKYEFSSQEKYLPVVVNSRLVDMYNISFAETNNMPRLNAEALIGEEFILDVGYSAFSRTEFPDGSLEIPAKLVGFSDHVAMIGVTIPLEKALEYNNYFRSRDESETVYNTAFVFTDSAEDLEMVSKKLAEMNLNVESLREAIKEVDDAIRWLFLAFTVVGTVILIVAAFNILNMLSTAVLERFKEIGIMRSIGATKKEIRILFISEAGIIGITGGIIGILFGLAVNQLVDWILLGFFPDVTFKPETLFKPSWLLIVSAFLFSLMICLIAGFYPANRAAKVDPIEALRYE